MPPRHGGPTRCAPARPAPRRAPTPPVPTSASRLEAQYAETVPGTLYVRLGLSPNPRDLAFSGQTHLTSRLTTEPCGPLPCTGGPVYELVNTRGGAARVSAPGMQFIAAPAFA